jgi:Fe-S cluster biogenesis protein NfuA
MIITKVEKILDDQIRPALASHGGNIEIIDFDNYKLFVKLSGGCQGCSSSKATLKDGIEKLLQKNFPDFIHEVVDLTDHTAGENPFM